MHDHQLFTIIFQSNTSVFWTIHGHHQLLFFILQGTITDDVIGEFYQYGPLMCNLNVFLQVCTNVFCNLNIFLLRCVYVHWNESIRNSFANKTWSLCNNLCILSFTEQFSDHILKFLVTISLYDTIMSKNSVLKQQTMNSTIYIVVSEHLNDLTTRTA